MDLGKMTTRQVRAEASKRGVPYRDSDSKALIIARILYAEGSDLGVVKAYRGVIEREKSASVM